MKVSLHHSGRVVHRADVDRRWCPRRSALRRHRWRPGPWWRRSGCALPLKLGSGAKRMPFRAVFTEATRPVKVMLLDAVPSPDWKVSPVLVEQRDGAIGGGESHLKRRSRPRRRRSTGLPLAVENNWSMSSFDRLADRHRVRPARHSRRSRVIATVSVSLFGPPAPVLPWSLASRVTGLPRRS